MSGYCVVISQIQFISMLLVSFMGTLHNHCISQIRVSLKDQSLVYLVFSALYDQLILYHAIMCMTKLNMSNAQIMII